MRIAQGWGRKNDQNESNQEIRRERERGEGERREEERRERERGEGGKRRGGLGGLGVMRCKLRGVCACCLCGGGHPHLVDILQDDRFEVLEVCVVCLLSHLKKAGRDGALKRNLGVVVDPLFDLHVEFAVEWEWGCG